ncbi:ATP-dependent Clp protease proteolytic subunit [Escherichia coli]|nr:ATP-dependent Clp protease proteolytic subunit [Escherichia coli]
MDVASLDKARQLMRVQKEGERHLNIRPAFVLVPTAMESVANQVHSLLKCSRGLTLTPVLLTR